MHVAVPEDKLKLLVPPSQLSALPDLSVMTKFSVPVGVPSEAGWPLTVAVMVAVPPLLVGRTMWTATAEVPRVTFSWKVPTPALKLASPG